MLERKRTAKTVLLTREPDPFTPEAGAEPLPGYRLQRLRGRGAFATVWEASTPSGDSIAMKFLSSQNTNSTAREIRTLQGIQRLEHPNLLQTRRVWSMPGYIVIAMDLADASLLDLYLLYAEEFQQAVDVKQILLYLHQAAVALDYLNARSHAFEGKIVGFQHGDVKPNNILLVADEAKLADYGLALPMNGSTTPCYRQGTLDYAAPEIFLGNMTDTSDQYSLAVTYYLLRTGAFPFPSPPKVPGKNYYRPPPDLSLLTNEEQPVLARALTPAPQSRFPSCTEMMAQLLRANSMELVPLPNGKTSVQLVARSSHISSITRSIARPSQAS